MLKTWALVVAIGAAACSDPEPVAADMADAPDAVMPDVGRTDATADTSDATADVSPDLGPVTSLETLLEREVTFSQGESPRLAVTVPDDAVSVTVSVDGPQGYTYALSRWSNGDGEVLVPNTWVEDDRSAPIVCTLATCLLQIAGSESSFAAQLPNNARVSVVPGTHNIGAFAFEGPLGSTTPANGITATIRVVAKRLPAPPDSGSLDINFYFTGARGWTAATAPTDAEFQAVLAELQTIYDQVDISLGTITYTDIPAEHAVVENIESDQSDLEELFLLSAGEPRRAVNVFMIERIFARGADNEFAIILGVSGGLPGPPLGGTARSGVAISSDGDPRAPTPTAEVIAHEVGHHLGLYHTTEAGVPLHDPIEDTPENDESMLMHAIGSGSALTPTQGMVMRHNVWVR